MREPFSKENKVEVRPRVLLKLTSDVGSFPLDVLARCLTATPRHVPKPITR